MSRRRQIAALTVATLALAAVSATGAVAKTTKKAPPKLKSIKGSYAVQLVPDPTIDAELQVPGSTPHTCQGVDAGGKSVDIHPLSLPGSGTLHVVLDSPDPTGKGKTDWDLAILNSAGSEIDASNGETSHEETYTSGLKKGKVSIEVCNLIGEPNANVSWSYTYR